LGQGLLVVERIWLVFPLSCSESGCEGKGGLIMDIMGAESVVAHDHSSAAAPPIYLNKKTNFKHVPEEKRALLCPFRPGNLKTTEDRRHFGADSEHAEGFASSARIGRCRPGETRRSMGSLRNAGHARRDLDVVSDIENGENLKVQGEFQKVSIRSTNIFRKEEGQGKMIGHDVDLLSPITQ